MTRKNSAKTQNIDEKPVKIAPHRAQLLWSMFVAVVVATVALQQAMSAHREPARNPSDAAVIPQALITGQPLPLQSTLGR